MADFDQALAEFLAQETTLKQDKEILLKFLQFRPQRAQVVSLLPNDELEEKVKLVKRLISQMAFPEEAPSHLDTIQIAMISVLPTSALRDLDQEQGYKTKGLLRSDFFKNLQDFVGLLYRGKLPKGKKEPKIDTSSSTSPSKTRQPDLVDSVTHGIGAMEISSPRQRHGSQNVRRQAIHRENDQNAFCLERLQSRYAIFYHFP
ncbi:hypothetical protein CDD82_4886 [Ophiocordyceps australis]|uniref:Uncharacterized protein n=1 Tax=Ophiocordyceps australis TaxID=1399860 RepID=A0A2C5Z5A6_9HYPO|nr:hypothetical protein CDD82_4886 [Ophiocordyceps australis]